MSGKLVQNDTSSLAKSRLKLSGLVTVTAAGRLQVRNRIYERVFGAQWAGISTSRQRRPRLAFFLVPALLLTAAVSTIAYRATRPSVPTAIVMATTAVPMATTEPSHTPEPTPTKAPLAPTATEAGPTSTPTPTATKAPPTPTATEASPTATLTPTPAEPLTTAAPTPTMVPVTPEPGIARATQRASIFAYPNEAPYEITILPGQSIQLLGQVGQPWRNWLYVYYKQDNLTGFIWKPYFEVLSIIPLDGTARATEWAWIYAYPNQAPYDNNYSVGPGQSVQLLGRTAAPWDNWLYVRRIQPDLEGFVWKPFFEILPTLELARYEKVTFCTQGQKRFGFEVQVTGGDGSYTFLWGDQAASKVEARQDGVYLVSWAWEEVSLRVGTLTVRTGDGQIASTPSLDFIDQEPSCE